MDIHGEYKTSDNLCCLSMVAIDHTKRTTALTRARPYAGITGVMRTTPTASSVILLSILSEDVLLFDFIA